MKIKEGINIEEVKDMILTSTPETAVYVGCDSQRFKEDDVWKVVYVRAIVIHKDSCHGAKIFWDSSVEIDYGSRRLRLMNEVYKATEIAMEIADIVGNRPFQVHLDINRNPIYESNVVMSEAIGYVRGMMGMDPVLKSDDPRADYPIAASAAADRFATRKAIWH